MRVKKGSGTTPYGMRNYGPGIEIELSGDEVAGAIYAYLVAHDIWVHGPRTVRVNGELCKEGNIYVDPSGDVIHEGMRYLGRTGELE